MMMFLISWVFAQEAAIESPQVKIARLEAQVLALQQNCAPQNSTPKKSTHSSAPPKPNPQLVQILAELEELKAIVAVLATKEDSAVQLAQEKKNAETLARIEAALVLVQQAQVEAAKEPEIVESTTRFHAGLSLLDMLAPPMPGEFAWSSPRIEAFGQYEWNSGKKIFGKDAWVGLEIDGGIGFETGSASIRFLPVLVLNVGQKTDIVAGAGVSALCETAFAGGESPCSVARNGFQTQVEIDQQMIGPVAAGFFLNAGFDWTDSVSKGPGRVGYGMVGVRFFFGSVGSGETL